MSKTSIEWATHSWNPVTGCTPVSEGCQHCYAKRMANRLRGRYGYPADDPFKVTLHPERLEQPLHWKKPREAFVCSMGDLFHEDVPFEFIKKVWNITVKCPRHVFLFLTKRPKQMEAFTQWMAGADDVSIAEWPRNCWLGVTAENQQHVDERIPILLQIPAAKRFVSVEPMLGPVDLLSNDYLGGCINCEVCLDNPETCINCAQDRKIDWIICGGETGPGARPMHPDWVRSLRNQCQDAGVPFFFKQWGNWYPDRKGIYEHVDSVILGDTVVHHIGKKAAGRLLDGRTWEEKPNA